MAAVGSRVTAPRTLSVAAGHEGDASGLPDLRGDWYVPRLKIERRQIGYFLAVRDGLLRALPMRARNRVPSPIGSGVSNSTPAMAGLNDGSLRESATVSNTCSTGAAMRT